MNRFTYYKRPYYHKHHHFFTELVTIILIGVIVLIGIGAYQNHSFPFNGTINFNSNHVSSPANSNSSTQTTQQHTQNSNIPKPKNNINKGSNNSKVFNTINTFWTRINNILGSNNGTNTSLTPLFTNGNNNHSYQGIKNWLKFVTHANSNNDTKVISIIPYNEKATNKNGIITVKYQVKYDFRLHNHSNHSYDHIQIYNWTAKFTNGSNQIITMQSPHDPEKDYTK